MSWVKLVEEKSALTAALDLLGDRWTLLIITGCLMGYSRFNQMERRLGINRNLLKSRLDRLVSAGVLDKQPTKENSKRYEYIVTNMCLKLRPVIVGLASWGEEYLTKDETPITYVHEDCGGVLKAKIYCELCQQSVDPLHVKLRRNAGAGEEATQLVDESH